MGCINVLRNWTDQISASSPTLRQLMAGKNEFSWPPEAQVEFDNLKEIAGNLSFLSPYDNSLEKVYINCDASRDGIGYITYQIKEDGKKNVIQMGSSALKENQKRWSMNELETLAVAYAAEQSKFFITCHPGEVKIFSDNATICGMFKKDFTEIENPRISKLFESLTHYNIRLEHTSGKTNTVADALSRATTKVQDDMPDVD